MNHTDKQLASPAMRHPTGRIRPFIPTDREPLCAVIEATNVFRPEEVEVAVELMDAAIYDPEQRDYVLATYVDEAGSVRGYYCYGPTPMTQSTFDLYWIAVDPALHGSGIGSMLLTHCEESMRSSGGSLVVVETSSLPKYEATRRFYRRHRYDETARLRGYYAPDDDLVIFTKHL
jgi:ribosomal protein S18 acetylase RimI-like enzyme